ncbi:hypothetical protein GYA49_02655 [Candidatus Beckwithbacteria bacterium]|nr:hypothetical protein [Candidatus Beckwithbacteria bacterium]
MKKQIFTIGYEIPGNSDNYLNFYSDLSLMDADILLISPESLYPSENYGNWIDFSSGGGCYNVPTSSEYEKKIIHLQKEITDFLQSGKSVFIVLSKKQSHMLSSGVSHPRKGESLHKTYTKSNYDFLPISIGTLISASGKHICFSGNPTFRNFYNSFKDNLEYKLYVENPKEVDVVFTGKTKTKILGAIYKIGTGYLITLPMITFNEEEFTKTKKGVDGEKEEVWNKKGLIWGSNFIQCLIEIDNKLTNNSEKTTAPEWVSKKEFISMKEEKLLKSISKNKKKVLKIKEENEKLKIELEEEITLKDLLFEQGKPLENAVIKALKILGYQAENYDDGNLEMDQVITSPEEHRYIGESEGKDSKDINVTKYRQLIDALNADFARDEVEEKAFGILFGNPERFIEPKNRKVDFTAKCKTDAKREKIALIKTSDLFLVAKYLHENNNKKFKKECREAIHSQLGELVKFPEIPKKE